MFLEEDMMEFQKAKISNLTEIMDIIGQAQEYLRLAGIDQWQNGYPNQEIIRNDIEQGNSYVLIENDRILATACLEFAEDPNYQSIYEGTWLTNGAYGAIHRIAVATDYKGGGLSAKMIKGMQKLCQEKGVFSLKVDTHDANKAMQRMLTKNDFEYCGIIYLADGSPRIAFEKVLEEG